MSTTFRVGNISVILPQIISLNVSIGSGGKPSTPPTSGPPYTDPYLGGVNCSEVITVSCLLQLYNAANYTPVATSKNSIGITGYLGQFANQADLTSLYQFDLPYAVNATFKTVFVNSACPCAASCPSTQRCVRDFQMARTTKLSQRLASKPISTLSTE